MIHQYSRVSGGNCWIPISYNLCATWKSLDKSKIISVILVLYMLYVLLHPIASTVHCTCCAFLHPVAKWLHNGQEACVRSHVSIQSTWNWCYSKKGKGCRQKSNVKINWKMDAMQTRQIERVVKFERDWEVPDVSIYVPTEFKIRSFS